MGVGVTENGRGRKSKNLQAKILEDYLADMEIPKN